MDSEEWKYTTWCADCRTAPAAAAPAASQAASIVGRPRAGAWRPAALRYVALAVVVGAVLLRLAPLAREDGILALVAESAPALLVVAGLVAYAVGAFLDWRREA